MTRPVRNRLLALLATISGAALAGEPATPLGKWMKPNMGTPLAGEDFATLQKSFEFIAARPPSADYPKWAEYSNAGARAAGKEHIKDVKAACKICHDAYKDRYKKEFATKAFP